MDEQEQHIQELVAAGVLCKESNYRGKAVYLGTSNIFISPLVEIGEGTIILPNVYLLGDTKVGENCEIGPDVTLRDSVIQNDSKIKRGCEITSSQVGKASVLNPFCYISDSSLGDNCVIWVNVSMYHAELKDRIIVHRDSRLVWSRIGEGSNIEAGCQIKYASLCENCRICHSIIEGEKFNEQELSIGRRSIVIAQSCAIGPWAYIYGRTMINPEARIVRSEIQDSFIGTSVIVHGARVQDSTVYIGSVIEEGAWIHDNSVIHGNSQIARAEIIRSTLDYGTKAKRCSYIDDVKMSCGCNVDTGTVFGNDNS